MRLFITGLVKAPDCPHYITQARADQGARMCRPCVFRPVRPADTYGTNRPFVAGAGQQVDDAWDALGDAA